MNRLLSISALALGSLISVNGAFAQTLPKNDLWKQDGLLHVDNGITQSEAQDLLNKVSTAFSPIVASHKGKLKINLDWSSSEVNADSEQTGSTWSINVYGGIVRRPEMTADGLTLVTCHEMGHHLGGYYFFDDGMDGDWAAVEGEADYFATQVCVRKLWSGDSANAAAAATVPAGAKKQCDSVWTSDEDKNLCYRVSNASQALGNLLGALDSSGAPDSSIKDTSTVDQTNEDHPEAQCRLDTYLAGATCPVQFDLSVIPGRNDAQGQNSLEAEMTSAKYTCFASASTSTLDQKTGARPACWFKAQH